MQTKQEGKRKATRNSSEEEKTEHKTLHNKVMIQTKIWHDFKQWISLSKENPFESVMEGPSCHEGPRGCGADLWRKQWNPRTQFNPASDTSDKAITTSMSPAVFYF